MSRRLGLSWLVLSRACRREARQPARCRPGDRPPDRCEHPQPASLAVFAPSQADVKAAGPLAILVRNPGIEPGLPPYALADQSGAIQRYVEPTPGADLESHVGQTVRVKHDTGRTLLSTQLVFTETAGGVFLAAHEAPPRRPQHSNRTADFTTPASAPSGQRAAGTIAPIEIAPIGIVAEEISTPVPDGGEPIWLDEMESPRGAATGGCNCERCRAARGESFGPSCNCPECAGRGRSSRRGFDDGGWNCCICDALFGNGQSPCGPSGCEQVGYGSDRCSVGCGSECGCDLCENGDRWTRVQPGIIGSAEILLLRGYDSEPNSVSSTQHETGSRFELGYMNDSGRSWRVRYFEFNHPNFDGNNYLDLDYLDLEYAGRFTLGCNWRGELSGGLRWAQVDDEGDNLYEDPLGPVIGGQLRSPCCLGLELFGLARQSYQYGQEERDGDYGTFGITEIQLGLEYQTCACGGTGFGRAFIEGQSWQGIEDGDSEDAGLFGFGFAVGLTR